MGGGAGRGGAAVIARRRLSSRVRHACGRGRLALRARPQPAAHLLRPLQVVMRLQHVRDDGGGLVVKDGDHLRWRKQEVRGVFCLMGPPRAKGVSGRVSC